MGVVNYPSGGWVRNSPQWGQDRSWETRLEAAAGVQVREGRVGWRWGKTWILELPCRVGPAGLADRLNIRSWRKSTPMEGWSWHWLGQRAEVEQVWGENLPLRGRVFPLDISSKIPISHIANKGMGPQRAWATFLRLQSWDAWSWESKAEGPGSQPLPLPTSSEWRCKIRCLLSGAMLMLPAEYLCWEGWPAWKSPHTLSAWEGQGESQEPETPG